MKPSIQSLREQLDKLDQLQLFRMVLGISDLKPGKMIKSPIRLGDAHPSFNIYRTKGGRYAFKDFAYEQGSIYDLVSVMHGCTYAKAVEWLADRTKVTLGQPIELKRKEMVEPPSRPVFGAHCEWEPKTQDGLPVDDYWLTRYQITDEELARFRIWRAEWFRMRTKGGYQLKWTYSNDAPLYVMEIGKHLKAYRPLARKDVEGMKYIGNTDMNDVFGEHYLDQVKTSDVMLFTGGQKDAAVATLKLEGVKGFAFNSESTYPTDRFMLKLVKLKCAMAVCYDNDKTGMSYAQRLNERFPFIAIIRLGELYPATKDIADAYQVDKLERLKPIINSLRT